MGEIANSTFLDFTGWHLTNLTSVAEAYGLSDSEIYRPGDDVTFNVALVLKRANDPTDLLSQDWGARQHALKQLDEAGTLWSTYGADAATFNQVVADLQGQGVTILGTPDGYVTSAESRTVWMQLNATTFENLFGAPLWAADNGPNDPPLLFWTGNLFLEDSLQSVLGGLWADELATPYQPYLDSTQVTLPQGAQSPGNSGDGKSYYPQKIAEMYNFPLAGRDVPTADIAVVEPTIGTALPPGSARSFQELLDAYRRGAGIDTPADYYVVADGGQSWEEVRGPERSLDIGVLTATNPNSRLGVYVGSGLPFQSTYTGWQSAIWDAANNPGIVSSSFDDGNSPSPDSPFLAAYRELFTDAALRNVTIYNAAGDGGSSGEIGNGLNNVIQTITSPYAVLVGGTSLSTHAIAQSDPTLDTLLAAAHAGNLATVRMLVAGGLKTLPSEAAGLSAFIETVWNTYALSGDVLDSGYNGPAASAGGADSTQPIPHYQTDYGLDPMSVGPLVQPGRGVPDVAALAGGNMFYTVPDPQMTALWEDIGTSAATPLWASLSAQIDTIFADQDLPRLGYLNDLLYTAAVVAPAAFNDITLGNNISTFTWVPSGGISSVTYDNGEEVFTPISPTGHGFQAGPGYDQATGLGSPNGLLLARALTAIAHQQYSYDMPDVLVDGGGGVESGTEQSLLFQPMLARAGSVTYSLGGAGHEMWAQASSAYGWSSQFAQQSLQADFSSGLATLFDGHTLARTWQADLGQGEALGVTLRDQGLDTPQINLSSAYGFVDFVSDPTEGGVHVARPVAVAETVNGEDDQTAIVRLRQNGTGDVSMMLYRVDDLSGLIGGLRPGEAGYAEASLARAYHLADGDAWIRGPGYGEFRQVEVAGIDSGAIIAMRLSAGGHDYWAFADANESVDGQQVGHLWNYGLNTWGWEDLYGGGDLDYNDLVVGLDFTSAYGSGWLV